MEYIDNAFIALIHFLKRRQIAIACVTHLVRNEKFKIPGYKIYRKDRETEHVSGGVAIFIKI